MRDREPRPAHPRREQRQSELRVFGLHACLAVFRRRREAIRKVYLEKDRLGALREVIAHCVANRIGYRLLPGEELEKLTKSQHHEGVCFEVLRAPLQSLDDALAALRPDAPAWFAWLDGVGNPHNLGAMLRTAAHFGCAGLILPRDAGLGLSGAACRVAEGGAEAVPLIGIDNAERAIDLATEQVTLARKILGELENTRGQAARGQGASARSSLQGFKAKLRDLNMGISDAKEFAQRAAEDAKDAHADVKDAYAAAKDGAEAAVALAEKLQSGFADVIKAVTAMVVEAEIRETAPPSADATSAPATDAKS